MILGLSVSLTNLLRATPSTTLRRESDGSVTIVSVGSTWQPILTRQSDGSVTVGAA